jgi:hypothetical protein
MWGQMAATKPEQAHSNGDEVMRLMTLHPAWQAFIACCRALEHGEIACLKIQDGLPVMAEVVTRKVRFC